MEAHIESLRSELSHTQVELSALMTSTSREISASSEAIQGLEESVRLLVSSNNKLHERLEIVETTITSSQNFM